MTNLLALLLLAGLAALELLLYFGWPAGLSRLALLPLAKQSIQLKPPAEVVASAQGSYRTPGLRQLSLTDIEMAPLRQSSTVETGWYGTDGWLRLRYGWYGRARAMAVARITTQLSGNTVTLRARVLPTPFWGPLFGLVWLIGYALSKGSLTEMLSTIMLLVAVIGMSTWTGYRRMRNEANRMFDSIANNIRYTSATSNSGNDRPGMLREGLSPTLRAPHTS